MMEKKRRITRSEFPNNPKHRVIWSGKVIRITYTKDEELSGNVFSTISSKKSLRTASSRNLFKRRVYHTISKQIIYFDLKHRSKFIISILREIKKTPTFLEIKTDIDDFLRN